MFFEQVLLSRVSFFGPEEIPDEEKLGLQMYSKTAEYVMCSILPDSPTKTTKMTDGNSFLANRAKVALLRVGNSRIVHFCNLQNIT